MRPQAAEQDKLNDPSWLRSAYLDAGRSVASIAADVGVGPERVRRALRQFAIPRRAPGGSTVPFEVRARLRDADWLRAKLCDEALSDAQIAAELGVVTHTVVYWRARHELRPLTATERTAREVAHALPASSDVAEAVAWVRRRRVADGWSWARISAALGEQVSPSRLRRLGAAHGFAHPRPSGRQLTATALQRLADPGWLARRYDHDHATLREIAAELDVGMRTVERALRAAGIARRRRGPRA